MRLIKGTQRNDVLTGTDEDERIQGLGGHDELYGRGGDDWIHGGSGLDILRGEGGNDHLYGDDGEDFLHGGDGNDRLLGGSGWDQLYGGPGRDTLDGGSGVDYASLDRSDATGAIHFSLANPSVMQTLDNGTTVVNVERAFLHSGSGNDQLRGGRYDDVFRAGAGDDRLEGGDGDDELYGGDGNDTLVGGQASEGSLGGEAADLLDGGAGNDVLYGGLRNRLIDGGDGVDRAYLNFGGSRQDLRFSVAENLAGTLVLDGTQVRGLEEVLIWGGRGHDWLTGGEGSDTIHGGSGLDILRGEGGNDHLYGDDGEDFLHGGDGNDRLLGGSGWDQLYGGPGRDTLDGGSGVDYASLDRSDATGAIHFSLANPSVMQTLDNGTTVVNVERAFLHSGSGNDQLRGGRYDDVFRAGAGDDRLEGGDGDDRAVYSGRLQDYWADRLGDGSFRIVDVRGGAPDGTDLVRGVELFEFADGVFTIDQLPHAPRNRAPEATPDIVAVGEDSGASRIDVLANDRDPDSGDRVTIASIDTAGLAGLVTLNPDGSLSYASNDKFEWLAAGQAATDTFRYAIQDLAGFTSAASVTVTILGANDAPIARGEGFTIGNTGATALGNLLANDSDVDQGDTISLGQIAATSARGAAITIDAQGRAVYDPGDIFAGLATGATTTDSFSYTVVDSHGAASTATVNLTINGGGVVLDPRLRITESVNEDEVTGNLYELINDAMAQFGPGTSLISIDTAGTLGTVTLDANAHVLTYAADHPSLDSLAHGDTQADTSLFYTVLTPGGDLRTGEIRMRVFGVNDSAIAVDDAVQVGEGQVINLASTLLANDLDPDSSAFQFVSVDTTGTLGRAMVNPLNGTLHYAADTPQLLALDAGEMIVDHFTYTIRDLADGDHGPTSTATIAVTVTGAGPAGMGFLEGGPLPLWGAQTDMLV